MNRNHQYYFAIIGVVAIVAVIAVVLGLAPRTFSSKDNFAGEAFRVSSEPKGSVQTLDKSIELKNDPEASYAVEESFDSDYREVGYWTLPSGWQEAAIARPGNNLELYEQFREVKPIFGANDLSMLKGGTLQTSLGTTQYVQTVDFSERYYPIATHTTDRYDMAWDFVFVKRGDFFLDYWLRFASGFRGAIDSNGHIPDFVGKKLYMLGTEYDFVSAKYSDEFLYLLLVNKKAESVVREGQSVIVSVDGVDYDIALLDLQEDCAIFAVNGEYTPCMQIGKKWYLGSDNYLVARELLHNVNSARFYISNYIIEFSGRVQNESMYTSGFVAINGGIMNDARVSFEGSLSGNVLRLNAIRYAIRGNSIDERDLLVGKGEDFVSKVQQPEMFLGGTWNIDYRGLAPNEGTVIVFAPYETVNGKGYELSFTNELGLHYSFGLLWNEAYSNVLSYGNGTNFTFTESNHPNIQLPSYFAVKGENTSSRILMYIHSDEYVSRFVDIATGVRYDAHHTVQGNYRVGDIVIEGQAFRIWVDADNNMRADLNGDGQITHGLNVPIVVAGGGEIIMDTATWNQATIRIVTPHEYIEGMQSDLPVTLNFELSGDGIGLQVPNSQFMEMHLHNYVERRGMTRYGSLFRLYLDDGKLSVLYPNSQLFPQAYLSGKKIESAGGSSPVLFKQQTEHVVMR